jgi:hypothetical protein
MYTKLQSTLEQIKPHKQKWWAEKSPKRRLLYKSTKNYIA